MMRQGVANHTWFVVCGLGFRVWGLVFGVWSLVCEVWGLGFGVWAWGLGFRVWDLGFMVDSHTEMSWMRKWYLVEGLGFKV